jgi:hypothetical protein
MRVILLISLVAVISTPAYSQNSQRVPLQNLLDKGFKVVAGGGGELIVQKDNQVYGCYRGEQNPNRYGCDAFH